MDNNKKYNSDKAHQYYKKHSEKHNEHIICPECHTKYKYYSKSKHIKSQYHLNAVECNKQLKEDNNIADIFKLNNDLSEEQINKMKEMSKDPRILNAFIHLVINAFNKPPTSQ